MKDKSLGLNLFLAVLFLLWSTPHSPAAAQRRLPPEDIKIRGQILSTWLHETGLSDMLDFLQIRFGPHPYHLDRQVYKLELSLKPQGDSHQYDRSNFAKFNAEFERVNGIDVHEKLFYKFVHLLNIPPDRATIHILIYHEDLTTYRDEGGQIITRSSLGRNVLKHIDVEIKVQPVRANMNVRHELAVDATSFDIQRISKYFKQLYPPDKATLTETWKDRQLLRFSVRNLKGVVIVTKGFWERLEISIIILGQPSPARILAIVDGQFAAGVGSTPPGDYGFRDMEPKYTRQLSDYTGQLLVNLKEYLAGNR